MGGLVDNGVRSGIGVVVQMIIKKLIVELVLTVFDTYSFFILLIYSYYILI